MSLLLKTGEQVSVPPAGHKSLILDVNGDPYLLLPDGSLESLGGSALWGGPVADFVLSLDPTLVRINWWSACDDFSALDRGTVVGTGANYLTRIGTTSALKVRLQTGTTINSSRSVRNRVFARSGAASVYDDLCTNVRTARWALAGKCIVNAVNATALSAILNMTDEATADCFLGTVGASGGGQTNFSLKIGAAAAIDTGVPFGTLGTTEHLWVVWCDGTNVRAYYNLDTTAVATGLSNTAANAAGHFTSVPANAGTASNVSHDLMGVAAFGA